MIVEVRPPLVKVSDAVHARTPRTPVLTERWAMMRATGGMMGAYFDDKDLAHFGDLKEHHPELWSAFERYYGAAFEPGLLSRREKVLIGFAVALGSQCPYCVDSYTQQALEQGLTIKHLAEAMHAAASLRAGITLAHGLVAHNVDKKVSM